MNTTDDLVKVEAWLKVTGMTESRLGLLACANPRAVERIRDGTARIATLMQVVAYIDANPIVPKRSRKAQRAGVHINSVYNYVEGGKRGRVLQRKI